MFEAIGTQAKTAQPDLYYKFESNTQNAASVFNELAKTPAVALELYFLSRDERLRGLMWDIASLSLSQFKAVQLLVKELTSVQM